MWHCSCPGAGCRHMRTLGLPGRPSRGYHNHHNSPGRHCHLKNKHRLNNRYLQIFFSTGRTAVYVFIPLWLLAMSLLETENIKFFFTAHSEPISCSSGMPVEDGGIIFNHMSSKLWETLEKRAIWHSFPFTDIIRCVGNGTYEGGGMEKNTVLWENCHLLSWGMGTIIRFHLESGRKALPEPMR